MTTKHTCNEGRGPAFGRKTCGCPRCDELLAGAAPATSWHKAHFERKAREERQFKAGLARALEQERRTGIPSTFGEW